MADLPSFFKPTTPIITTHKLSCEAPCNSDLINILERVYGQDRVICNKTKDQDDILRYGLEMSLGKDCYVVPMDNDEGGKTYHITFPESLNHVSWPFLLRIPLSDIPNSPSILMGPREFSVRLDFYTEGETDYLRVTRLVLKNNPDEKVPNGLKSILKPFDIDYHKV